MSIGRRELILRAATLAAPAILGVHPAWAEPSLKILPLGFAATEFRGPASRVAATIASIDGYRESRPPLVGPLAVCWGQGGSAALVAAGDEIRIRPAARRAGDLAGLERGRGAIPDSRLQSAGALTIQLEDPTRDYAHEALGSAIHARALSVTERRASPPTSSPKPVQSDVAWIEAGPGAVFEDREPQVVDLDRDGSPEILAIRSYLDRGSALAVIGRREGTWRILAETPPDGEPFRWLNPVPGGLGAARPGEFALVRRPHLDGLLQIWRFERNTVTLVEEKAGYANHAYSSRAQALSVGFEAEDGTTRLAIPSLDRHSLAILSLAGGIREIARIPLPARILTGVASLGRGRDIHLLLGLEDGRVADLRP
ncbi:hypothetical protein [uncultured Enterovirga sp.]|uniref:hypothetical protein n=1 Tax=uncultured Enterovirga sp. TaxID=2026352 RepID=UPI0035CA1D91